MSSAPHPAPAAAPAGIPTPPKREITLISHSMLFYWWPIWVLGFIMALITYFDKTRLAVVPPDSKLTVKAEDQIDENTTVYRLAAVKHTTDRKDPEGRKKITTQSLEDAKSA